MSQCNQIAPPAATHPLPPPPREAADAPQIFSFGRSEGCQRAPVSCSSRRVLLHGVYCARCARFHQAAPARAEFFLSFFFLATILCFTHARAEELAIGGLGQPVAVRAAEPLRAMTCFRLRACALLYGFNYRLQTQTELLFRCA